jgi:hypothetical protein
MKTAREIAGASARKVPRSRTAEKSAALWTIMAGARRASLAGIQAAF